MPPCPESIRDLLEQFRDRTEAMLRAANAGEWERLIDLEAARFAVETELRGCAQEQSLASDPENAKLLREVLAQDDSTRAAIMQAMDEAKQWLRATGRERAIRAAYGSPP